LRPHLSLFGAGFSAGLQGFYVLCANKRVIQMADCYVELPWPLASNKWLPQESLAMQKSAVTTKQPARFDRQLPEPQLDKGQKYEAFYAFGADRRSAAWLQKVDRKR
jgi:hypothetical protein